VFVPKHLTRLERAVRDKHSRLLRKSVNYGRNKFYDTGPRSISPLFNDRLRNTRFGRGRRLKRQADDDVETRVDGDHDVEVAPVTEAEEVCPTRCQRCQTFCTLSASAQENRAAAFVPAKPFCNICG
jgi:hypothetical protein